MKSRQLAGFTLLLCSFVFLSGIAFGQRGETRKEFAEISNQGSSVTWSISEPHKSADLTVIGPNGVVFRRVFPAGTNPVFSPSLDGSLAGSDGMYQFEISLTPVLSADVLEEMRASRQNGTSDEVAADLRKRGMIPPEMRQEGTFRIIGGQLFTKNDPAVEEPASKEPSSAVDRDTIPSDNKDKSEEPDFPGPSPEDQQILDDLIVVGSACIGQDCVNGESFGFDTIRVKENNLRIKFQDTSTSASFPTNDWELTANDSSNGGANRFSITDIDAGRAPFTVVAGAPANSLYVNSSGRIGIKTSTPVVEIHNRDGDTPTLRLEQDGSSGFTAQTWDIAGNETNFFIRDVTNGSRLPFKIRPGAATDSLVIEANGDLTVGKTLNNIGNGTSATAPASAQQFYGGNAVPLPAVSSIAPVIDTNTFGASTGGQAGFTTMLVDVPSNLNLEATNGSNVVFKIRYRDADGTGASSMVSLNLVTNDINTGARTATQIFDSNSNAATGANTVTVCTPVPAGAFNYASNGTHIFVVLIGTAALSAEFTQVQVYKIKGSC